MKKTESNPIDRLVETAADIAMKAAAEYARVNGLKYETEAMVACLRAHLKAGWKAALYDAKQALDAGMPQVAEATFKASMAQIGIEAAREAGFPEKK